MTKKRSKPTVADFWIDTPKQVGKTDEFATQVIINEDVEITPKLLNQIESQVKMRDEKLVQDFVDNQLKNIEFMNSLNRRRYLQLQDLLFTEENFKKAVENEKTIAIPEPLREDNEP